MSAENFFLKFQFFRTSVCFSNIWEFKFWISFFLIFLIKKTIKIKNNLFINETALRAPPAVTRLTVHRRLHIWCWEWRSGAFGFADTKAGGRALLILVSVGVSLIILIVTFEKWCESSQEKLELLTGFLHRKILKSVRWKHHVLKKMF